MVCRGISADKNASIKALKSPNWEKRHFGLNLEMSHIIQNSVLLTGEFDGIIRNTIFLKIREI